MSGYLYGSEANDRAMRDFDAWLTHDPREDDSEEVLAEAEAADRLRQAEDAGGVVYEPSPGEFRVARDLVLLGGGESMESAVEAAFAVMFPAVQS